MQRSVAPDRVPTQRFRWLALALSRIPALGETSRWPQVASDNADAIQCLCRWAAAFSMRNCWTRRLPIGWSVMNIAWSRWLFGAWAALAAVWLVVATLMLVQTRPEPRGAPFGVTETQDESAFGQMMKGQVSIRARQHIRNFLLFAILPPGFLLLLVLAGLRIAGLPFPSLRREGRDKLPSPR